MPAHFSQDTFQFLRQLHDNNNRDWFQAHKDEYHENVRDPFLAFIKDLNPKLNAFSEHYHGSEKPNGGALFRIYRDTRFSKDKTPYKTWAGARFTHREVGKGGAPILYLHLQPDNVFVAAGLWRPEGKMLNRIRTFLHHNPRAWQKVTSSRTLTRHFTMGGESLKRVPRGFDADHPLAEDLKRKDFVVVSELSEAQAVSGRFLGLVQRRFAAAAEYVDYLCAALDLEF